VIPEVRAELKMLQELRSLLVMEVGNLPAQEVPS
jgi:hypothetical protein